MTFKLSIMKMNNRLLQLVLLLSTLLIGSCHKIVEYWPDHTPPHYRIKSIFFDEQVPHSGNFYYNKWGNPDSVVFEYVATGRPNFYFTYNKKQQLREIKAFYVNGAYEQWHRLGVNKKGQVIIDTVYTFGGQNQDPEPANFWNKRIDYYEYDNLGRIIKRTFDFVVPEGPSSITNFVYNADGNLDNPYIVEQYDNNRNLLTLHPIWQFLQCDYSVNNPFPAESYNSYRLPTRFDFPLVNFTSRFTFFGGRALEKSEIVYENK